MTNPKDYHFTLPQVKKPLNIKLPEVLYPGIQQYWKRSTSKRIFNPIYGIKAVVIHATAGYASSHAVSVMKRGKASWHWLIPDEDESEHGKIIWACAPETLAAWHVLNSKYHPKINKGQNRVNHWSLGIEIVNSQQNDPFSEWQVKITADIVKYCWAKYPNLEYVVSHAMLDPNRRTDPGKLFPWSKFKDYVLEANFGEMLIYNDVYLNREKEVVDVKSKLDLENICC